MMRKAWCKCFLILLSSCGNEVFPVYINKIDNSHIILSPSRKTYDFFIEEENEEFFKIIVKVGPPSLPFPDGTTNLANTFAFPSIIRVCTESVSFYLPHHEKIHANFSTPPEDGLLRIKNNSYIVWEGNSLDPFPELLPDHYTLLFSSSFQKITPCANIGFSSGTRYVEYLWVMFNGFAYPVVNVNREETVTVNIPSITGTYSLFTSSNFLINSFISPDSMSGRSEPFEMKGKISHFPLIMLFWMNPVDLDLHIIPYPYTSIQTSDDCYYDNKSSSWGCRFLEDNKAGFGRNLGGTFFGLPEIAFISGVLDGDYIIAVNPYNMRNYPQDFFTLVFFFSKNEWTSLTYPIESGRIAYPLIFTVKKGKITEIRDLIK